MSLEQVLAGAPENTQTDPDPAPKAEPQPDPALSQQPGEKDPAPTPGAKPDKTVPLAALEDERSKRQTAERELAELRKQQPAKPDQQEKPGFWEKPEEHLNGVRQFAATEALKVKLDMTEERAREKYDDFDAQLEAFGRMVEQNPALRIQMLQARNPAEFAYSTAKNHSAFESAGSVEKMREQIRAEERAKLEAEAKAKAEAEQKKRDALPSTLTDVQGGTPRAAEFTGPTPLNDILK